jgi:hypothetical protein
MPGLPELVLRSPITVGSFSPRDYLLSVAQPYHQEVMVEKSDVEDVCLPIVERYGLNYQQFTGQAGWRRCIDLVRRVQQSGRPCRIHYISDFDPQGENMPVAVARKIEWILRKEGLDLDIQVIPLALTKEQCIDLKLPRAPIKEGDRAKGQFEERHGEGATELDALEALHPGLLGRMLEDAILRYYDPSLLTRTRDAIDEEIQGFQAGLTELNELVVATWLSA